MKFRNKKTGKIYDMTSKDCSGSGFCREISCSDCPIIKRRGGLSCRDWVLTYANMSARLMGYEVVEDDCDQSQKSRNSVAKKEDNMDKPYDQQAKSDAGKLELDLVPTQIIRDIAEVRMYGDQKYGDPENWKTVELRRYINAMLRHTLAFIDDPTGVDAESGIPHYKHAECNWAFISEMMKGGTTFDEVPHE